MSSWVQYQMTLSEALEIVNSSHKNASESALFPVCGFQPLHLATFIQAHAARRLTEKPPEVRAGLFGDLLGNLERAGVEGVNPFPRFRLQVAGAVATGG